jgi:hypothetical protein
LGFGRAAGLGEHDFVGAVAGKHSGQRLDLFQGQPARGQYNGGPALGWWWIDGGTDWPFAWPDRMPISELRRGRLRAVFLSVRFQRN